MSELVLVENHLLRQIIYLDKKLSIEKLCAINRTELSFYILFNFIGKVLISVQGLRYALYRMNDIQRPNRSQRIRRQHMERYF